MNSESEIGQEMYERIHSGDSFLRVFDADRRASTINTTLLSTRSEEDQLSSAAMSDLDSSINFDSSESSNTSMVK